MAWELLLPFLLLLGRSVSFVVVAPPFNIIGFPPLAKVGIGFVLAITLYPITAINAPLENESAIVFILALAGEVLLGLTLGFVASLVVSAIRQAGQFADLQLGFALSGLLDPLGSGQLTLIGRFYQYLGMTLFLNFDGHHRIIAALADSLKLLPLGGGVFNGITAIGAIKLFGQVFALGLRLAAPLLAVMLIADLALGFISRGLPQLNILIMGFPLKVGLAILVLLLFSSLFGTAVGGVIEQMDTDLKLIIGSLVGGGT